MGLAKFWHELQAENLEDKRQRHVGIFEANKHKFILTPSDEASDRIIDAYNTREYHDIAYHIGHGATAPSVDRLQAVTALETARDRRIADLTSGQESQMAAEHPLVPQIRAVVGFTPEEVINFYDPIIDAYGRQ